MQKDDAAVDKWIAAKLEAGPVPHFAGDGRAILDSYAGQGRVMDVTSFLSRTDRSEARAASEAERRAQAEYDEEVRLEAAASAATGTPMLMSPSSVHTGLFAAERGQDRDHSLRAGDLTPRDRARFLREQVLGGPYHPEERLSTDQHGEITPGALRRTLQPGQLLSPTGTMANLRDERDGASHGGTVTPKDGRGDVELDSPPPPPPPRSQPPQPSTFTADTLASGPPLAATDAAGPADAAMAAPGADEALESSGMQLIPAPDGGNPDAPDGPPMRAGAKPADPLDAAGQAASNAAKSHRQQVLRGIRRLKDTLLEAAEQAEAEVQPRMGATASGASFYGQGSGKGGLPRAPAPAGSTREPRKRPWELIRAAANDLETLQGALEDAIERHSEAEEAARRVAGESLAARRAVEAQLAAVVHALHDLHERHADIEARRTRELAAKDREVTRLRRAVDMQAEAGRAVMDEAHDGARMLASRAVHERAVAEEAQARADEATRRAAIAQEDAAREVAQLRHSQAQLQEDRERLLEAQGQLVDQLRKRCLAADRRAADAEQLAADSERMRLDGARQLEEAQVALAQQGGSASSEEESRGKGAAGGEEGDSSGGASSGDGEVPPGVAYEAASLLKGHAVQSAYEAERAKLRGELTAAKKYLGLSQSQVRAVEAQRADAERRASRTAEESAQLRGYVRALQQDLTEREQARARSTAKAIEAARGELDDGELLRSAASEGKEGEQGGSSAASLSHGSIEDLRAALENVRAFRRRAEVAEEALEASRDAQRQASEQAEQAVERADSLRSAIQEERQQWEDASKTVREDLSKTRRRLVATEYRLQDVEGKLESSRRLADDRLREKKGLDRQLMLLEARMAEEQRNAQEALEQARTQAEREREQAKARLEAELATAAERLGQMHAYRDKARAAAEQAADAAEEAARQLELEQRGRLGAEAEARRSQEAAAQAQEVASQERERADAAQAAREQAQQREAEANGAKGRAEEARDSAKQEASTAAEREKAAMARAETAEAQASEAAVKRTEANSVAEAWKARAESLEERNGELRAAWKSDAKRVEQLSEGVDMLRAAWEDVRSEIAEAAGITEHEKGGGTGADAEASASRGPGSAVRATVVQKDVRAWVPEEVLEKIYAAQAVDVGAAGTYSTVTSAGEGSKTKKQAVATGSGRGSIASSDKSSDDASPASEAIVALGQRIAAVADGLRSTGAPLVRRTAARSASHAASDGAAASAIARLAKSALEQKQAKEGREAELEEARQAHAKLEEDMRSALEKASDRAKEELENAATHHGKMLEGIRLEREQDTAQWEGLLEKEKLASATIARRARQVTSLHLAGAVLVRQKLRAELADLEAALASERARAEAAEKRGDELDTSLGQALQRERYAADQLAVTQDRLRRELEASQLATKQAETRGRQNTCLVSAALQWRLRNETERFAEQRAALERRCKEVESRALKAVEEARAEKEDGIQRVEDAARIQAEYEHKQRAEEDREREEYLEQLKGLALHRPKQQACLIASTALIVQSDRVQNATLRSAREAKREATQKAAALVRRNWQRREAFEKHTRCLVASWTLCRTDAANERIALALYDYAARLAEQADQHARRAADEATEAQKAISADAMDALRVDHSKQLAEAEASHKTALEAVRRQWAQDMERAKEEHEAFLAALEAAHEKRLAEAAEEAKAKVYEAEKKGREAVTNAKREAIESRIAADKKHRAELAAEQSQMADELAKVVANSSRDVDAVRAAHLAEIRKMQSMHSVALDRARAEGVRNVEAEKEKAAAAVREAEVASQTALRRVKEEGENERKQLIAASEETLRAEKLAREADAHRAGLEQEAAARKAADLEAVNAELREKLGETTKQLGKESRAHSLTRSKSELKLRLRAPEPRLSVTSVPPSPVKTDTVEKSLLRQERARADALRDSIEAQRQTADRARRQHASLLLSAHLAAQGLFGTSVTCEYSSEKPISPPTSPRRADVAPGRTALPWSDAALQVVAERNAAKLASQRADAARKEAEGRIKAAETRAAVASAESARSVELASASFEEARGEAVRAAAIAQSLARARVAAKLRRDREASLRSALQRAVAELERHVRRSEVERVAVGVQAQLEEETDSEYETDDSGSWEYTDATPEADELALGLGQTSRSGAVTPPPPPTVALSEAASTVGPPTPLRDTGSPSDTKEDAAVQPPPPPMEQEGPAPDEAPAPAPAPAPEAAPKALKKTLSWLSPAVPKGTKKRLSMAAKRGNTGAVMHGGKSLLSDDDLKEIDEDDEEA